MTTWPSYRVTRSLTAAPAKPLGHPWAKWVAIGLRAGGVLGLLFCLFIASRMMIARRASLRLATGTSRQGAPPSTAGSKSENTAIVSATPAGDGRHAVIGRVEIPALHLVTPLMSGDDSMSLTEGAGHIPGTAVPGGLGTVGIAGHRDTHFRQLSQVKPGMDVRLIDQSGTYHYSVTSTEIVMPEQVEVLDIQSKPGLVLITCYPFRYIGAAPKRFIVHAALISVAPDGQH
jgi:sortase A